MKDKRPTFRINFNTKDKELIDFLETTFPTMTDGIIESIIKNKEHYENVDNPHEQDLLSAPVTLKKRIIQNMSFTEYKALEFLLAEINGIYNSKETIDIQHKKREVETIES